MKTLFIVLAMLLLSGCAAQETYERVEDTPIQEAAASPRQILVALPEDAIAPVLDTEGEQVYLSQDHEIFIETRASGDLRETVQLLSGYAPESLTVLKTSQQGLNRYDFVWACAGEEGERLGRGVILDDGNYHYCMSVLRDAQPSVSQISWEDVFSSFRIAPETEGTGP